MMEWTPLMHAVRHGEIEVIKDILKSGEKFQIKNELGADLLMLASASGSKSTVKLILAEIKNKTADNVIDLPASLRIAALYGHLDIVQFILGLNCDPNAQDPISGATALMLTSSGGHDLVARLLLEYGALTDITNASDQTALDIAVVKQNGIIVKLLTTKASFDLRNVIPNLKLVTGRQERDCEDKSDIYISSLPAAKMNGISVTEKRSNSASEVLSSPAPCTPKFSKLRYLSPLKLLSVDDPRQFSPGDDVFLSENEISKNLVHEKAKQTIQNSNMTFMNSICKNATIQNSDTRYCMSPEMYSGITKDKEISNIDRDKCHHMFDHCTKRLQHSGSFSESNSPCSLSSTPGNIFSRSDPSIIHELNGGVKQQKCRSKALWLGITKRVRSLRHYKSGYHFYHPYYEVSESKNQLISSPRILNDDCLVYTRTETTKYGKDTKSSASGHLSPLRLNYERSDQKTKQPIERMKQCHTDFIDFLCFHGLQSYINNFLVSEIDLSTFFDLRDPDLREIGIYDREMRNKILHIISSLRDDYI